MSLNTNGWDYGYHIKLNKANEILTNKSTNDTTNVSAFLDRFTPDRFNSGGVGE